MKHGKYSTYKTHKCRCSLCTAAHSEYKRLQRQQYSVETVNEHGTYSSYVNHNCRCSPCKAANKAQLGRKIEARQKLVNDIKLKAGCADCGYNDHPVALDFDHVRGEKIANVSHLLMGPLGTLMAEIDKCEVVCSNHHRIRTWNRNRK